MLTPAAPPPPPTSQVATTATPDAPIIKTNNNNSLTASNKLLRAVKSASSIVSGNASAVLNNNNKSNSSNNGTSTNSTASTPDAPCKDNNNKDKKRHRHKDAEKIEKLRLLVSYLKSGTNQQLLNPVNLEADEIELARRYKQHIGEISWALRHSVSDPGTEFERSQAAAQAAVQTGQPANHLGADSPHQQPHYIIAPVTFNLADDDRGCCSFTTATTANNSNSNNTTITNTNANTTANTTANSFSSSSPSNTNSCAMNPQNLATWIDNEVNSLVNDLEVESQLIREEKQNKSHKRRWLPTSSRRSSSGSHST